MRHPVTATQTSPSVTTRWPIAKWNDGPERRPQGPQGWFAQSFNARSLSELAITEKDDKLIASAAIMGESSSPITG